MANLISQVKLPNNTIYTIRDPNARTLTNNDFDTINVTELNAGDLIVTGVGRFTNGLYGNLNGTATQVSNNLKIQLNSGTTEGTNQFTYNGSSAKTVNITKSGIGLGNVENKSSATIRGELTSGNVTTALGYTPLNSNLKGGSNGLAELDANGLVPSSQLPSYVDDVLEYSSKSTFPTTGETGKIYVATDTNLTYRWSGSAYTEISPSLALGETSSTAYRGDRGATAYSHATDSSKLTTATASGLYKVASTAQGHIASLTAVTKADITGLGIPGTDTNTHRPIQMNGTEILGNNTTALNLKAGTNVSLSNSSGTVTITSTDTNTTYSLSASGESVVLSGSDSSTSTADLSGAFAKYTPYKGNLSGTISSGSPAADLKTYWDDNNKVKLQSVNTAYNSAGQEYSFLLSKGNSNQYGAILRWTYANKYIEILRKSANTWQSTDWERISAGYADKAGADGDGNIIATTYLPKTTYEYNKEISFGSSGKLLIGKFSCYDSNVTIEINSTTGGTYHATAILATQNVNDSGGGTITWKTYGDASNTVTPNLYLYYPSNSRWIEIYFSPSNWSKNIVHIQCLGLYATPTNICESVTEIPAEATTQPTNTLLSLVGDYLPLAGGQMTGDIIIPKNDNMGIKPNTNNYGEIGHSNLYFYRSFITHYYGTTSHITNWDSNGNIGSSATSSAASTRGYVNFYNTCAAGGTQTKTTLYANVNATANTNISMPTTSGTLALASTTLSGYGITDAKIASGVITLGSNTITPLTASSTLDATKLSGTIPSSCYTDTKNTAGSTDTSSKIYLIGATSQAANPQTYSQDTAYVGTDGCLYSGGVKVLTSHQDISGKVSKSGDTMSGTLSSSVSTSTHINGARGTNVIINSTASSSGYNMWIKSNSTNGAFNLGYYQGGINLYYISQTKINAGTNSYDKQTILMNESGDMSVGGALSTSSNISASGNISATGAITASGYIVGTTYGVSGTSGTSGGISLYNGASYTAAYGIAFRKTGTGTGEMGKHGFVQGDWATYFTMDGADNRGWVFRNAASGKGNVASISSAGHAVFNGSVTVGGNTTNTSGVRQVYDSSTKSLNFVFVA